MELIVGSGEKVVGLKQSLRAIRQSRAAQVFLAEDAQASIRTPVLQLCSQMGIAVQDAPTMARLGKAFGIDIGAAVAVVLTEE